MQLFKVILLLSISVICYAAAFPPLEWAFVEWFAPAIWLFVVAKWPVRRRFRIMFAVGYLGSAIVLYWLTALFSTMALLLWMVPGFYFGLWGAAIGWFAATPWQRASWPAIAWMGIEFFRCELAPLAFSFGGLGYGQVNWLGFFVASGIGVYGLSGLMVLAAALAVETWRGKKNLTLLKALGFVPIAMGPLIALVPPTAPVGDQQPLGRALLQQLAAGDDIGMKESLPARGEAVDLIVWPEFTFGSDPRWIQSAWFMNLMQGEAAQAEWGVLFGAMDYFTEDTSQDAPYYNSAFYVSQNGKVVARAAKNQPVQLMFDGLPAPDVVVVDMVSSEPLKTPPVRAGIGICYDGCFQSYSRKMVHRGADYLVFPTMNLESWGVIQHRQHQGMFQMRAAETGRTVLTAAVSGPTFAAAPGGAVSEGPLPFGDTESLRAQILRPSQTAFNLGGWIVGPLSFFAFGTGILWKCWSWLRIRFFNRSR